LPFVRKPPYPTKHHNIRMNAVATALCSKVLIKNNYL